MSPIPSPRPVAVAAARGGRDDAPRKVGQRLLRPGLLEAGQDREPVRIWEIEIILTQLKVKSADSTPGQSSQVPDSKGNRVGLIW